MLGIPSVSDRIAQTVVKLYLEPEMDNYFHPDSYGYRPGKSAIQAVAITRQRCWKYGWLFEYDITGAFDNIDHGLLIKALKRHTESEWILLYITTVRLRKRSPAEEPGAPSVCGKIAVIETAIFQKGLRHETF